ncbi:DUF2625 domain-containing protein [Flavobacterium endoglycinae]|uniref:DUF2625 domain-containing protein n=1 Tax=Flavobacterium endoglycinae TaxID=2816357 RepID=A0ABX7QAS7_9FLAO|nr:DUF2625 domain-containing protein [Flavobacterium endoglycinae]QSW88129.1 DUF2625 domain-containing protein [Flavobacterium endoglycinae]
MHSIDKLINNEDSAWADIQKWISEATNKVEILPTDVQKAEEALYQTQVTTRSPMGAIIYMTGGILIDNGWIRILGSGNEKLKRTLPNWNLNKTFKDFGEQPSFLLIADDAIGGFFALNGGKLGNDLGKVYYFAPDTLEFEPLDVTYTDFLLFCFNNDLEKFYEGYKWKNWKQDVSKLNGDQVFNFIPFLWSEEGEDIEKASRKEISIEEQYNLNLEFRKELGLE